MRRGVRPVLAGLLAGAVLGAAPAAPPTYRVAIFSGRTLLHRIALTDSTDVAVLLDAVREPAGAREGGLSDRPYVDVALFEAMPMSANMPLERVPLDAADAHARFYPGYGDDAPYWEFGTDAHEAHPVRYVLQRGLDLLQRRGVPVRMRPGG